jgi:uncharacterized protein YneF (UPF0154 family)
MPVWLQIVLPIITLIVGAVVGFFVSRAVIKKYLKKNPPVSEKMIRAMFTSMGRTPTEKQVRQVMRSMDDAKTSEKKEK